MAQLRHLPIRGPLDLTRHPRDAEQSTPPFFFDGVSVKVFPLRAEVSALQAVCDNQLNTILPPEVGRFRVAGPYVYLMMLDYGRLSETQKNMGWFAQKEILFCFPTHWYKVVNGRWRFFDFAMLTPFIYVDDDLSVPLGRQAYGWGKTGARLTPTLSRWMEDPRADVLKARVNTMVYPELYTGRELRSETFLEVEREPPLSFRQYPPDPRMPFAPWNMWWNVAHATMGWARDMEGWLRCSGVFPVHPGTGPRNMGAMATRAARFLQPDGQGVVLNTLNLKQFRLAHDPDRACYQSLTNGPMRVRSLSGTGGLGEDRVLAGDVSGGYGIKLHEWPSVPIVESLGLDVHRRWQGPGAAVALLKPVMPFWYKVDMEYLPGQNIAWRSDDGRWRDADGSPLHSQPSTVSCTRYNTAVTSSPDPIVGPFEFRDTTIRVLPLLAKRKKLEEFLSTYMDPLKKGECDDEAQVELVPWRAKAGEGDDQLAYVYLTASSFGAVDSDTNNIGDWAKYELSFLIPVKCKTKAKGSTKWTVSVGLVPAYTFVDTTAAEIARMEVLGVRTAKANFVKPDSAWLSEESPLVGGHQVLLRLEAEVLPALNEGRGTENFTLVEITEQRGDEEGIEARTRLDVDRWAKCLKAELERKKQTRHEHQELYTTARAVTLETLGQQKSFAFYTVKEFPDVEKLQSACYTALIVFRRTLEQVLDVREIETLVTVCIHDFPSRAIVRDLGIIGSRISEDAGGIIHQTQAIRPFFMNVTMKESLGERLIWRVGALDWQTEETCTPEGTGQDEETGEGGGAWARRDEFPRVAVSTDKLDLARLPDMGDPREIERVISLLLERAPEGAVTRVKYSEAMEALDVIDPQILIEAMLSREWGNRDENTRWLGGWRRLRQEYEETMSGILNKDLAADEKAFFLSKIGGAEARPGQVPVLLAEKIIPVLEEFTEKRVALDNAWPDIAAYLIGREHDQAVTDPQSPPESLQKNAKKLSENLEWIANEKVEGWSIAPDYWTKYKGTRANELQQRLLPLVNKLSVIGEEPHAKYHLWLARDELREAISLAYAICDMQREALLIKLSKIEQKPDFCVMRDAAGARKHDLFPRAWSWDDEWYHGPPIKD